MADLGALDVLPTELQLMVLDMANVQSVCRFSQVNRRAHALVEGLSISPHKVRVHFPRNFPRFLNGCSPRLILPASPGGLGTPTRVATSDVWSYGILASTLCDRSCTPRVCARSTYRSRCRQCVDRSLTTLSIALLDPKVEECFHDVSRVL
ncbi:hypothetical protein PG984_016158 [Apiospora sp. TS-2023a]